MFIVILNGASGVEVFDHNPDGSKQDMNEAILAFDPFQEEVNTEENGTRELLKQFGFIEV